MLDRKIATTQNRIDDALVGDILIRLFNRIRRWKNAQTSLHLPNENKFMPLEKRSIKHRFLQT